MLTKDEELIIAREAIRLAELHISACPFAEKRLAARADLNEAESALARGAARPSLRWSCSAVRRVRGMLSPAYMEVQAKYDAVYNSHLSEAI